MRSLRSFLRTPGVRSIIRGALSYLFGRRGERRVQALRLTYRLRLMVMLRSSAHFSKLAQLPEARLRIDGRRSFSRIEYWIRHARHTIVIQMFIWRDDETGRRIASLLIDAAERGVQVDIMKDAIGDFFEVNNDFLGTQQSPHDVWRAFWKHPRIRVSYGTQRDHAKVYVIDDQILLLTGMNIADEYRFSYHDYLVELRGKRFVEQFLTRRSEENLRDGVQLVMNTEEQNAIRPALMRFLRSAQESMVIEHCYLSDPEVLDEILAALRRGVRTTVIVPASSDFFHYANTTSIGRLLTEAQRLPLRVFLYPDHAHGKVILVDRRAAFIGSANLVRSSLDDMGEVNVLIRDKRRFIAKLDDTLRRDMLRSRPLTAPPSFLWATKWIAWLGL